MVSLTVEYKGDGHEDALIAKAIANQKGRSSGTKDTRRISFEFPDKKAADSAMAKLKKVGLAKILRGFKATIE